jgi:serine/threonine-protein kinase
LPFFQRFPGTGLDIWILPFTRDANAQWKPGKPFVFLNTSATEAEPAFSPDGRWVAYESSETGVAEVYVRPFPGPGGKWQVSNGGGSFPVWSKNGRELFYRTNENPAKIMVATYRAVGDVFQSDKAQLWSPGDLISNGNLWTFDLAPDGKRFAVLANPESESSTAEKRDKFVVILNAFDDLLRKSAPAKP